MADYTLGTKDAKNTLLWIRHANSELIVCSDQEKKFFFSLNKLLIAVTVAHGCDDSFKGQKPGTTC